MLVIFAQVFSHKFLYIKCSNCVSELISLADQKNKTVVTASIHEENISEADNEVQRNNRENDTEGIE